MLNPKKQRFIDYYIELGDAGAAYAKAGFVANTQNSRDAGACRLLRSVKNEVAERMDEISKAGRIRIESKRVLLWEIAQKASGRLKPVSEGDEPFQPDYRAAIAAVNELNRMDGHHSDKKIRIQDERFTFDAEILPPEPAEDGEFMQLDEPEK